MSMRGLFLALFALKLGGDLSSESLLDLRQTSIYESAANILHTFGISVPIPLVQLIHNILKILVGNQLYQSGFFLPEENINVLSWTSKEVGKD